VEEEKLKKQQNNKKVLFLEDERKIPTGKISSKSGKKVFQV